MASTAERLRFDLDSLTQRLGVLVRELPVEQMERFDEVVIVGFPDYWWGERTAEQLNTQLTIKRDYEEWFEVFRSVFSKATDDLDRRIQEADLEFRKWVELGHNYLARPIPHPTRRVARSHNFLYYSVIEPVDRWNSLGPRYERHY